MFYMDNQGPWNGADALKELRPGYFMGHPAGLAWYDRPETKDIIAASGVKRPEEPKSGSRIYEEAKKIPLYMPPAIIFPYPEMGQSGSGIACDLTQGKFGPFEKQLFIGDQSHSTVMRVFLEKVKDRYQGACFPFRQGFDSGNLALEWADDGSLFVYGTDRGWGARGGHPYALQRLVWTGKTPFEIHEMRAKPDGFEFTFTGTCRSARDGWQTRPHARSRPTRTSSNRATAARRSMRPRLSLKALSCVGPIISAHGSWSKASWKAMSMKCTCRA